MLVIGTFLVLTFGLSWASWAFARPGTPVFLIGVFAPGLIAVALTARRGGWTTVAALLGRIGRWRVGIGFYAFAILLMPLVKLTVAVLARGVTGAWPAFGETRPVVLLAATILSTLGQAGEEVGWRGYLLPRLVARTNLAAASLIIGISWATWHLPLFYAPGTGMTHQSFPLYAAQVTAYSVLLAWLYWRTGGSLLLPMLAHSAFNNMKDIVPSAGAPGTGPFTLQATLVFWLTVAILWVVAAVLLVRMHRASDPGDAAVTRTGITADQRRRIQ